MTPAPSLVGTLVAYTLARLCLVAAVAGLLVLAGVPLVLAVLIGVVAALPLSMLLLRGLRKRMDAASDGGAGAADGPARGAAGAAARRRPPRRVRRRSDERAEREADAGEHRPGQQ